MLIVVSSFIGQAQNNDATNFDIFNTYGNFGYSVAPVLFNRATITRKYGNTKLSNKPILSYQLGMEYHFNQGKRWGIIIGLNLTGTPLTNASYILNENDIYTGYNNQEQLNGLGSLYISIPLSIELKTRFSKKIYSNIGLGVKAGFLRGSSNEYLVSYYREDLQEVREVFAMYQLTNSKTPNTSIVLSGGLYFILKKCMIKTNLVYNKSFKNIVEGEYQFGNLLVSEPTRGDYKISGDYFALSTTIYFKIKKNKRKKKHNF
mgnify:FL=1